MYWLVLGPRPVTPGIPVVVLWGEVVASVVPVDSVPVPGPAIIIIIRNQQQAFLFRNDTQIKNIALTTSRLHCTMGQIKGSKGIRWKFN